MSSLSCKVFEEFATCLQWIVKQRSGLSTVDHYLDDFIFAGRNHKSCVELMNTFKQICRNKGFLWQKTNLAVQLTSWCSWDLKLIPFLKWLGSQRSNLQN